MQKSNKKVNILVQKLAAPKSINLFPLVLSSVQLSEIIMLGVILLRFPIVMLKAAKILNIITMVKTILTVLCFLTPLLGFCILIVKNGLGKWRGKYE